MVSSTLQSVFQDTVKTTSTHRKNAAALLKLHRKMDPVSFSAAFEECVLRILVLGKGDVYADRAVKFINSYLDSLNHGVENGANFISVTVLPLLLKGLVSSLKAVRYRSLQILASALNNLEEISEAQFIVIKDSLMVRLRDKEASIRAGAAICLCRLQGGCDDTDAIQIQEHLVKLLQYDSSSDVRKNILWNIKIDSHSLDALLSRACDIDASIRKLLYVQLSVSQIHYSMLDIGKRTELLQRGLQDRDLGTRTACMRLLCDSWIIQMGGIDKFVSSLDIHEAESSAMLMALFKHDTKLRFTHQDFDWTNLNPQLAFFLKTYAAYLRISTNDDKLDELIPSLSDFVNVLEHYMNLVIGTDDEAEKLKYEYVVQELAEMCFSLDLCDEIGRRKLEEFLEMTLVESDLPEAVMSKLIRLGLKVSAEAVYIKRLPGMIEKICNMYNLASTLRESHLDKDGVEPAAEWSDEKSICALKCMEILHSTFQLLGFQCPEYPEIYTLLEEYVFPCMANPIPAISELALACLAQCSLTNPTIASTNMDVFYTLLSAKDARANICFKFFVDLILSNRIESLQDNKTGITTKLRHFLQCENETYLSQAVEGYCKLFLFDKLEDSEALLALLILYYHPSTAHLQRLRQSLSYFFPIYGHSKPWQLKEIFVRSILSFSEMTRASPSSMLQPITIASQILDWLSTPLHADSNNVDATFYADLAISCLTAATDASPVNRRLMCQVISKLQLSSSLPADKIEQMQILVEQLQSIMSDPSSINALKKFSKNVFGAESLEIYNNTESTDFGNILQSVSHLKL
ncbi:hypothetical protein BATDEDRAFT_92549 [Batrachochytrium dendrobatidis JAM81]|uniref:Nuclear condensin complex subunit 3 C-terminal domain-containing protein n=2 Tax=Batrachochytrium dendrobatidis TaxID=109871 RepID=F4PE50_BATDJ|nr:condensin subunit YCG1 [Batrachochytrium dendrobatidis JAM81]EGF76593.1 hypothetical protein BATDEDRAFT_92549 [Batrachochytrium dendrobatidis JAM81]KAJ8331892.1 chromosome condensation complex Condensin, subunit G [Batrachochytrium dendrobatidis]KAK5672628.1 chromosome condensation complex Condensin, subunit G [Batrachochytrium dendrobatidis]OAJ39221.1 hypothetical protein BDEG_23084 [Batrachochytrium dendrobatidis JEL423]|eukprot:XP_006682922.1 hypothetical protein BATDEDRAFT_92549 [Batrachochytrium dendrobatidis JAM81]